MGNIKEIFLDKFVKYLLKTERVFDKFILDAKNVMAVYKNEDERGKYKIVHKRLENGTLVDLNTWYSNVYSKNYFAFDKKGFLKVNRNYYSFQALYDYKNANFIVPFDEWNYLTDVYLEKYNGYVASFNIMSPISTQMSSINIYSGEVNFDDSHFIDGPYFAFINVDGSIRGNKLFKGNSLSQVVEIIDLNNYKSLDEFKSERLEFLNNSLGVNNKEDILNILAKTYHEYLTKEVFEVIELKK